MKYLNKARIYSLMLSIVLIACFALTGCSNKQEENNISHEEITVTLEKTLECIHKKVESPKYAQVSGEWAVVNLALGNYDDVEWFNKYLDDINSVLLKSNGILSEKKYTEYSRVVMALTAMNVDATSVAKHLLDRQEDGKLCVSWQGTNGSASALVALDFGEYFDNEDGNLARKELIEDMHALQREDGSWAISASVDYSDIDITAMVIEALAPYSLDESRLKSINSSLTTSDLNISIQKGLEYILSKSSEGFGSLESCSKVILCLSALERNSSNDPLLGDVVSAMYEYYLGDGMWSHTTEFDELATEQACYALITFIKINPKKTSNICSFSVSCFTALNNIDKCDKDKVEYIPENGYIIPLVELTFDEGDTVFDILGRICKDKKIHLEYEKTAGNSGVYIEGINNLYEMDITNLSGWMYKVNEWFPNYSISSYKVQSGDVIEIIYTCDLGNDIGGGEAYGKQ